MKITDALKTTALVSSGSPTGAPRPVARASEVQPVTPPTKPVTETALALYLMRVPASNLARAYSEVQALTAEPGPGGSDDPSAAPSPAPAPAPGKTRVDTRA